MSEKSSTRPDGVPPEAVDVSGDGGLCKLVLAEGDAAEGTPPEGALVQVHYVGTLLSDGSKFDSSRDRPGNFSFTIGQGQVIKGWDKGVATMHKGEKAELFCRADYAYGESGSPPKIPGGATLKFEVELLSWGEPAEEMSMDEDSEGDDGEAGGSSHGKGRRMQPAEQPADQPADQPVMGGVLGWIRSSVSALAGSSALAWVANLAGPLAAMWRALLALPHWISDKLQTAASGR